MKGECNMEDLKQTCGLITIREQSQKRRMAYVCHLARYHSSRVEAGIIEA